MKGYEFLLNQYTGMMEFAYSAFYYVHPQDRLKLINELKSEPVKEQLLEMLPRTESIWVYPSPYAHNITMIEAVSKLSESGDSETPRNDD